MKSLLISGISGKVGNFLTRLAKDYQFNLVCGVDKNQFTECECPIYKTFNEVRENVDIVIDFSSPELCDNAIDFCIKNQCKLVSGTTALKQVHYDKLQQLSQSVPICFESNFSQGIPAFLTACKQIKDWLPNFDCALVEEHNKLKKDAPSGTAKNISAYLNIEQVLSVRGGNISGTHKITFLGEGEEIEITHRAYDKSIFARGALLVAKKLLKKEKGVYSLLQLMQENS